MYPSKATAALTRLREIDQKYRGRKFEDPTTSDDSYAFVDDVVKESTKKVDIRIPLPVENDDKSESETPKNESELISSVHSNKQSSSDESEETIEELLEDGQSSSVKSVSKVISVEISEWVPSAEDYDETFESDKSSGSEEENGQRQSGLESDRQGQEETAKTEESEKVDTEEDQEVEQLDEEEKETDSKDETEEDSENNASFKEATENSVLISTSTEKSVEKLSVIMEETKITAKSEAEEKEENDQDIKIPTPEYRSDQINSSNDKSSLDSKSESKKIPASDKKEDKSEKQQLEEKNKEESSQKNIEVEKQTRPAAQRRRRKKVCKSHIQKMHLMQEREEVKYILRRRSFKKGIKPLEFPHISNFHMSGETKTAHGSQQDSTERHLYLQHRLLDIKQWLKNQLQVYHEHCRVANEINSHYTPTTLSATKKMIREIRKATHAKSR